MNDTSVETNSAMQSVSSTPPTKTSRKTLVLVLGLAVLGLCLCVGICGGMGGLAILRVYQEKEPVEKVLDQFMVAMTDKNVEKAYALFSTRAQRQTPRTELEKLIKGNNYVLFDNYKNIQVANINVNIGANTNPNVPQGTVAKVNGAITYSNGFTGKFDAVLEQEGTAWKLHNISIVVPPDKFQSSQ